MSELERIRGCVEQYKKGKCCDETTPALPEEMLTIIDQQAALLRELITTIEDMHEAMNSQFGNPIWIKKLGDVLRRAREVVK